MAVLLTWNDRLFLKSLNEKLCQQGFDVFATAHRKLFPTVCIDIEKIMLTSGADLGFHNVPPR